MSNTKLALVLQKLEASVDNPDEGITVLSDLSAKQLVGGYDTPITGNGSCSGTNNACANKSCAGTTNGTCKNESCEIEEEDF
ncbi:MAG: hypothetical protein AAF632_26840 [Bacteroidota bacterium]